MVWSVLFTLLAAGVGPTESFSRAWSLTNAMLASTHVAEADLLLSSSVTAGAELAMRECGAQFEHEVWNCPVTAFNMGVERLENNRETAYIHAVISAGVARTISRNCSQGALSHCGCEPRYGRQGNSAEDWQWGGCSDNLQFGEQISRQFLDTDTGKPRSLANLHNNQAGRIAVRKTMKTLCKCHGVSGSCATQTCWRQLGDFRDVGAYLKKQYKTAARVDYSNGVLAPERELEPVTASPPRSNQLVRSALHNTVTRGRRTPTSTEEKNKIKARKLVFLQPSPNYCTLNPRLGYKGVAGRTCNVDMDRDGAEQTEQIRRCTGLCTACGMRAVKRVVEVKSSCNCRFEWCCSISCDTCSKKQIQITCDSRH